MAARCKYDFEIKIKVSFEMTDVLEKYFNTKTRKTSIERFAFLVTNVTFKGGKI